LSRKEKEQEKKKKKKMTLELTWSSLSGFLRPIRAFTHFPEAPITGKVLFQQKKARNCVIDS